MGNPLYLPAINHGMALLQPETNTPDQLTRQAGRYILALMLILYFFVKIKLFNSLAYSTDLFSNVQISNGWLQGKHLLFENRFGEHSKIHNYYLLPLMGFLTLWTGPFGLFIIHITVFFIGATLLWDFACNTLAGKTRKWHFFFVLVCLLLGPAGFYAWDNPGYGYHVEMIYLPLSLIFIYILFKGRKWLILLSSLLLVAVKEDGAVMGACLSLAWLISRDLGQEKKRYLKWPLYLKITTIWVLIFLAGLLFLSYKNGFAPSRINESIGKIHEMKLGDWQTYFAPMLGRWALLMLPLWLYILFMFGWRPLLLCLFINIPLLITQIVSSLIYYPDIFHALYWVPRFVMFWTFNCGFILIQWLLNPANSFSSKRILVSSLLILGIAVSEDLLLDYIRYYRPTQTFLSAFRTPPAREDQAEVDFMRCLSHQLPLSWQIAPYEDYYSLFPYHTISFKERLYTGHDWKAPDIVIAASADDPALQAPLFRQYIPYSYGKLHICVLPRDTAVWNEVLLHCH